MFAYGIAMACGSCILGKEELFDWYGCIFTDGTEGDACPFWIPNSEALAKIKEMKKNWRKIYKERKEYNSLIPEEERVIIDRTFRVVR